MKQYIKPVVEVIELRAEEKLAFTKIFENSGSRLTNCGRRVNILLSTYGS